MVRFFWSAVFWTVYCLVMIQNEMNKWLKVFIVILNVSSLLHSV